MTKLKDLETRLNLARDMAMQSFKDGDDPVIVAKYCDVWQLASTRYYEVKNKPYLDKIRKYQRC